MGGAAEPRIFRYRRRIDLAPIVALPFVVAWLVLETYVPRLESRAWEATDWIRLLLPGMWAVFCVKRLLRYVFVSVKLTRNELEASDLFGRVTRIRRKKDWLMLSPLPGHPGVRLAYLEPFASNPDLSVKASIREARKRMKVVEIGAEIIGWEDLRPALFDFACRPDQPDFGIGHRRDPWSWRRCIRWANERLSGGPYPRE